jgi:RNAse (barnase) inhibitor barstar
MNYYNIFSKPLEKTVITGNKIPRPMPPADFLIIEEQEDNSFMLNSFTFESKSSGDTWHEKLEDAMHQAEHQYKNFLGRWVKTPDDVTDTLAYVLNQIKKSHESTMNLFNFFNEYKKNDLTLYVASIKSLDNFIIDYSKNNKKTLIKLIDGNKCNNKQELLNEFSNKLNFPGYFGNNWDAMDECINDLEWFSTSPILLIIKNFQEVLKNDPSGQEILLSILETTVSDWSKPYPHRPIKTSRVFRVIFQCILENKQKCKEILLNTNYQIVNETR